MRWITLIAATLAVTIGLLGSSPTAYADDYINFNNYFTIGIWAGCDSYTVYGNAWAPEGLYVESQWYAPTGTFAWPESGAVTVDVAFEIVWGDLDYTIVGPYGGGKSGMRTVFASWPGPCPDQTGQDNGAESQPPQQTDPSVPPCNRQVILYGFPPLTTMVWDGHITVTTDGNGEALIEWNPPGEHSLSSPEAQGTITIPAYCESIRVTIRYTTVPTEASASQSIAPTATPLGFRPLRMCGNRYGWLLAVAECKASGIRPGGSGLSEY